MVFPKPEEVAVESPSQDYSDRFGDDRVLRRHGYRIAERRDGCEAVWEGRGERYTQSEALARVMQRATNR